MAEMNVLVDGCDGDDVGLKAALGENPELLHSNYEDWGYGDHGYNEVWKTTDGKFLHAECGGCSCGGSGSWDYYDNEEEARRKIPQG